MKSAVALLALLATTRVAAAALHPARDVTVLVAPVNGAQTGTLALANDADTDVAVASIVADNTCDPAIAAAPLTAFTVPAHGSQPIAVSCKAHAAGIARCGYHAHDAAGQTLADFEVACAYASSTTLGSSANTVAFPAQVTVGGTAAQTLSVANLGLANEIVGRISFELTDLAGNFTIGAPCNPDARACDAGVAGIATGASTDVVIECTPHGPGMHTAQLFIVADTGQRLAAPIALSCAAITDPADPVILASPSQVELGSIEVLSGVGTSAVTIQNVGGGTGQLGITDFRIVDVGNGAAFDWTLVASGQCTGTPCKLAPGQQLKLALAFDPSTLGVRDATLLVTYTDTVARSRSIPLRGSGLGATLQLVGNPTIDFGTLPIGVSQAVTFELVNTGNRTVADVTLEGDGGAFTLSPKTVSLVHAVPVAITATCLPSAATPAMTIFVASAPDVLTGSPLAISAICRGAAANTLYGSPSTLRLGEIRIGSPPPDQIIHVMGTGSVDAVHLVSAVADLALVSPLLPATAPIDVHLAIMPSVELVADPLAQIVITPGSGAEVTIPVSGAVVSASFTVPPVAALGTYCIGQPTTSSTIALVSTGSATIALQAPELKAESASSFEIALLAPTVYPERLPPLHTAALAITPDRQTVAGTKVDELIWTTDVMGMTSATTKVTAEFVDTGGAIAPASLGFGRVAIHTMTPGQRVTVQNCNTTASLRLTAPHVPLPFSLDTPGDFPRTLLPNETVSFSVSFAPLAARVFSETMTISADTLTEPLAVVLAGEGITDPLPTDAAIKPPKPGESTCGCAAPDAPARGWPILAAIAAVARTRRRR